MGKENRLGKNCIGGGGGYRLTRFHGHGNTMRYWNNYGVYTPEEF